MLTRVHLKQRQCEGALNHHIQSTTIQSKGYITHLENYTHCLLNEYVFNGHIIKKDNDGLLGEFQDDAWVFLNTYLASLSSFPLSSASCHHARSFSPPPPGPINPNSIFNAAYRNFLIIIREWLDSGGK